MSLVCAGKEESVRHRALTEEHARDSFENLLFSVCRFRELTGVYPQNITVIILELYNFECIINYPNNVSDFLSVFYHQQMGRR